MILCEAEYFLWLIFGKVIYSLDFGTYKIKPTISKSYVSCSKLKNLNHVGLLMCMSEARAILPYDLPSIYMKNKNLNIHMQT